jgi:mono/diheme cytochrome c family protein
MKLISRITALSFEIILLISTPGLISMRSDSVSQQNPWVVPDEFRNMKNPVMADDTSMEAGKLLYTKHCEACHGKTGLGDGIVAGNLETFPGDFSGSDYQCQTDGEHFYKTKYGRGDMPKYENKIPDTEIWHMVNYMRSLKKD